MNKLLKGVSLEDRISVPTQRTMTDAGQMIVPCAFARTGALIYKGSSLGLQDQADELIEVFRKEEDVFAEDSMETFRSAPVTIGHPKDSDGKAILVDAENAKELQVGMLEGMPVRDEDLLTGTIVITNQEAIDAIEEGTVELSAGYRCDVYEEDGKYFQTNIKANHIAIVAKGRAGSSCSIADEAEEIEDVLEDKVEDKEPVSKSEIKDITDEFNAEAESKEDEVPSEEIVDAVEETLVDMSEAEAAEAVAVYEEEATADDEEYAMFLKEAADNAAAWANAHREVSKAARKIANKKAKSVTDEAEKGGDSNLDGHNLTDDVISIIVALDVADETISQLKASVVELKDSMDKKVAALCDVIMLAKDMTDIEDFTGKSVSDVKSMIVADVLDIDLSEKSEAYIDARFDILCEDSGNVETPMGRLLKNQVMTDVTPEVYVDPVKVARQKMIDAQTKK